MTREFTPGRASRSRRPWTRWVVLVAVVTALVLTSIAWSTVAVSGDAGSSGLVLGAPIPPWNNWTCNPNNPSPAALDIPLPNIGATENKSSHIVVYAAFKVVGYVPADHGIAVYIPTAVAVFPTSPSGKISLTIAPKTIAITGKNWTRAGLLKATATLNSSYEFSSSDSYLSTSKMAVMANATSGSLTLSFEWQWKLVPAGGGKNLTGGWSIPSKTATSPYLPSTFYPAPYIEVVSTSSSTVPAGSQFNMTLEGTISATSFRVVLEYPNNGTEIQSIWENSSKGVVTFNATVPFTFRSGAPVPAGTYIVHIHDICEAIVHIQSVVATSPGSGGPDLRSAARSGP